MKKLLAIFLSVLLLCAMLPLGAIPVAAANSGTTGDCTWTLDGTHLTISGDGMVGNYNYNSILPWGRSITSVTIENGVTAIGEYAFDDCASLTSVIFGDSVTTIGANAFNYCSSLTSVTIPDSVTTIGEGVFYGCRSLTSVAIPDSITSISYQAFCNCSSLTSVTIPSSVTTIGKEAFYNCDSLTSTTIPDSVTTIRDYAFYNCDSLTSITFPDSVTTIGDYAFVNCDALTSVTIPDSVTRIGAFAFRGCDALTSVTIGNNVTAIGVFTFDGCAALTSVTIGDSVTTIGTQAFYQCTSLTSVIIGGKVATIKDLAFSGCNNLTDVYYPNTETDRTSITIASGNSYLTNATWHYAADPISATVTHSVMDTDNGNGLAFRFELSANGVKMVKRTEVDLTSATVNYLGTDCKLVGMGAIITNSAAVGETKFTHADVNDLNVVDIPVVYLMEADEDSCAFATRIIDIPDTQLERILYARPYYIVEVDGEQITVYGDIDSASCADCL